LVSNVKNQHQTNSLKFHQKHETTNHFFDLLRFSLSVSVSWRSECKDEGSFGLVVDS
jgi:hypothetical protein